jgi:isopentenyl phosphate kinase
MNQVIFVKLGGSVITDKVRPETPRPGVIARLASEVGRAMIARPDLQLVLGHGSGSFGHMVARQYNTRQGVRTEAQWRGFAQVAAVAAQLNRIVTDAFLSAGVPVWALQPSASARCQEGELISLETVPMERALAAGLVPLVYGDVALDDALGGTIVSTEQVFVYLAHRLRPVCLILVGEVDGVFDRDPLHDPSARPVPEITPGNWSAVQAVLTGSHATDVTGGMLSKVEEMVALVQQLPGLTVQLISGHRAGALEVALSGPAEAVGGTVIHWQ